MITTGTKDKGSVAYGTKAGIFLLDVASQTVTTLLQPAGPKVPSPRPLHNHH